MLTPEEEAAEHAWFQSKWDALSTCDCCPDAHSVPELLALAKEVLERYEGTDEMADHLRRRATQGGVG